MDSYTSELRKLLRKHGCTFERQGKGEHEIWYSPITDIRFVVDSKIDAVLKQAGLSKVFLDTASMRNFTKTNLPMKILVTGATGFIGNYVIERLLESAENFQVIATSRNAESAEICKWLSQVRYVPCDLNAVPKDCFQYFGEPDLLIHLAWEGLPNYKDLFHFERNLYADYFFLKSMIEQGLKDVVVTGTCFEYGMQSGPLQ